MSCTNPKFALKLPRPDGKYLIRFIKRPDLFTYPELKKLYGDSLVLIPCGKCTSCIEQRSKTWAIRCVLEAQQYSDNCFLTLTYKPEWVPKLGLHKKHVQTFIKALRNKYGAGIRYFGCGEYGVHPQKPNENGEFLVGRPHYHLIVFNFFPKDAKAVKYDPVTDCIYYLSKELQSMWKYGFISVGEVSFNSCAYVARYCMKKIKDTPFKYKVPEFSMMSRRPGIGEKYFKEHFDSLVNTDRVYVHINNSFSFSTFRYFDKLLDRVDPEKLKELKAKRISNGEINVAGELLSRNMNDIRDYLGYLEGEMYEKYNRLKRRIS